MNGRAHRLRPWWGCVAGLASAATLLATKPVPVGSEVAAPASPTELRAYVESGRYDREIGLVTAAAKDRLRLHTRRGGERPVAIFDIDETLLSNLPLFRRTGYEPKPADWIEWETAGEAPVIAPVLELVHAARAANVGIVLLTGRSERRRDVTLKNLRRAGLDFPFELIMKPPTQPAGTGEFKERARHELIARGATIVLNIGDQASDLSGTAKGEFRLPNPFYVTH
jgi:hypothetical protein